MARARVAAQGDAVSAGFDDAMGEYEARRMRNYQKSVRAKRTPWKDIAAAWKALAGARGLSLATMTPAALVTDDERAAIDRLRALGVHL